MTGKRYKVWSRDPDGQPGALLLRTGSSEEADVDADFVGTPGEVAVEACRRYDLHGDEPVRVVLVKDFDTGVCYTVHLSSEGAVVVEGWH